MHALTWRQIQLVSVSSAPARDGTAFGQPRGRCPIVQPACLRCATCTQLIVLPTLPLRLRGRSHAALGQVQGFFAPAQGLPHSLLPAPPAWPLPPCSPQVNPELEGPTLPSKSDEEFRPFVRRLPEFKFW